MGPFVLPAISLGISALSSIFGAKQQSNAAKEAARMQQRATQQAVGMMNQAYGPYLQAGQGAVGVLNRLMTPGVPYSPQMQAQDAQAMAARPPFGTQMVDPSTPLARLMSRPDLAAAHRRYF